MNSVQHHTLEERNRWKKYNNSCNFKCHDNQNTPSRFITENSFVLGPVPFQNSILRLYDTIQKTYCNKSYEVTNIGEK